MNAWLYARMLFLYPPDLRRDFGAEMSQLFAEDLADARQTRGLAGMAAVWWCAICEFVRIGMPSQRANPAVVVPAIAFMLHVLIVGAEIILPAPHTQPLRDVVPAVILSSLVVAITALTVVHTGKIRILSVAAQA